MIPKKIHAHGLAILSGAVPHLPKSYNIASLIDNGVGSYQFVLQSPVDENYTCIVTARETREDEAAVANERNHYERSEIDFLVEVKDLKGAAIDADLNFMIVGDANG